MVRIFFYLFKRAYLPPSVLATVFTGVAEFLATRVVAVLPSLDAAFVSVVEVFVPAALSLLQHEPEAFASLLQHEPLADLLEVAVVVEAPALSVQDLEQADFSLSVQAALSLSEQDFEHSDLLFSFVSVEVV
jgi:hypothetical protein